MTVRTDVLICGAGIAGISTAYHLAVQHDVRDILLVDERAPLSLTSDKSTECYRNWWPGPDNAMVGLMNRSIDIMEDLAEQSGNVFHLNRRGYLFINSDPSIIPEIIESASIPPKLGAGPLRIYTGDPSDPAYIPSSVEGFPDLPTGADLFLNSDLIAGNFPYLPDNLVAALHVRRAGWFSAQQLGMYMLEKARQEGVRMLNARVTGVNVEKGQVVAVDLADGQRIQVNNFVNAAGPFINQVSNYLGIELPVFNELHHKAAIKDHLDGVPRNAPLLIWNEPQKLPWSQAEIDFLLDEEDTRWLLDMMPAGNHTRPEGGFGSDIILMLWEYQTLEIDPVLPPPLDPQYPEIVLRGLSVMLPRFREYFERMPKPSLDGGYYTKTKENRPLIGPLPIKGAYLIGALSGYGLMSSCGAGDLLAAHMTGKELPTYAPAFMLSRYQDPEYLKLLETWGQSGQL
jgi:glycine/D-amino acid oxidase-like deaminating enzyme